MVLPLFSGFFAYSMAAESAAPDESVFIDLTGGTDLMVASGYSVAMETRAVPIHIDLARREVFRVDTLERIGGVTDISLKDYLTAIGANFRACPYVVLAVAAESPAEQWAIQENIPYQYYGGSTLLVGKK